MRRVFALLSSALVLAVVAQFFLAASGAFDTAPADESFRPHRALGYAIALFALLVTVVGAVARMPGRLVGMTALVAGLVLVQGLIYAVAAAFDDGSTAGTLVFGLHAINALAIMAVSGNVARRARVQLRPTAS